jgi:hypothetical protein
MADELLNVTGKTTDGKKVVGGVYRFYETHGLPLNIIFQILLDQGSVPDWLDIYDAALAAGMKHKRILAKLEPDIDDSYGYDFRVAVIERLRKHRP